MTKLHITRADLDKIDRKNRRTGPVKATRRESYRAMARTVWTQCSADRYGLGSGAVLSHRFDFIRICDAFMHYHGPVYTEWSIHTRRPELTRESADRFRTWHARYARHLLTSRSFYFARGEDVPSYNHEAEKETVIVRMTDGDTTGQPRLGITEPQATASARGHVKAHKTEKSPEIRIEATNDANLAYALGRASGQITMLHGQFSEHFASLNDRLARIAVVEKGSSNG